VKSVLEFFSQFVLGVTGAVGGAALIVAGGAFAAGCVACGCGYTWRRWRRRAREKLQQLED
jgi:O-antigen/teichoic acid export membrane protein